MCKHQFLLQLYQDFPQHRSIINRCMLEVVCNPTSFDEWLLRNIDNSYDLSRLFYKSYKETDNIRDLELYMFYQADFASFIFVQSKLMVNEFLYD